MKKFIKNVKSNRFILAGAIVFLVQFILAFYNSIDLKSFELFVSGTVNSFASFLVIYALGVLIDKKEK